jgi:hypothetical protein
MERFRVVDYCNLMAFLWMQMSVIIQLQLSLVDCPLWRRLPPAPPKEKMLNALSLLEIKFVIWRLWNKQWVQLIACFPRLRGRLHLAAPSSSDRPDTPSPTHASPITKYRSKKSYLTTPRVLTLKMATALFTETSENIEYSTRFIFQIKSVQYACTRVPSSSEHGVS